MKNKIIVSALLIIFTIGINTNIEAAPWRHCYRHGWYAPHPVFRVCAPVIVGGYYAPPCYRPAYYGYIPCHHYHRCWR